MPLMKFRIVHAVLQLLVLTVFVTVIDGKLQTVDQIKVVALTLLFGLLNYIEGFGWRSYGTD